ncbi:MAG: DUF1402 family protein [Gemmatimonadota bacterium]
MTARAGTGRLAVVAGLVVAGLAGALLWWSWRGPAVHERPADDPERSALVARGGGVLVVRGNPGWEALSPEARRQADTPLSAEARSWLAAQRETVRRVATDFEVSPVALGGVVAAERTLLTGRVDALGEELFRAVLGSLPEDDLERWVDEQERAYRDAVPGTQRGIRNPYLWTLGPAQVSFRLALQYELVVAERLGRSPRNVKQVLDAVTSVPGNLEYAAALIAEAQADYRDLARFDIRGNPGVLATLYQLGSPAVRARRLADENRVRRARGESVQPPQVNAYGAFVNRHAGEIATILGAGEPPAELGAGRRSASPARPSRYSWK